MKKTLFILILLLLTSIIQAQTTITRGGYWNGKVADTILPNRLSDLKAIKDVENYLEAQNLEYGEVLQPIYVIRRQKADIQPIVETDTVVVKDTIKSTVFVPFNSYLGPPIDMTKYQDSTIVFRLNAGGEKVEGTPEWKANNIPNQAYNDYNMTGGWVHNTEPITRHESIPSRISNEILNTLFATEMWDKIEAPNLSYTIPLENHKYLINLYMTVNWLGTASTGSRVFDILIEKEVVRSNFDPNLEFGHRVAGMTSFEVMLNDGELYIEFQHKVDNPLVNAIEIIKLP